MYIMSTAGIYNYHPKVDNPLSSFPVQMESGGYQSPFYFGGSQIPISLGLDHHSIHRTSYTSAHDDIARETMKGHGLGVGLKTTSRKTDNIRLSKYMFHK